MMTPIPVADLHCDLLTYLLRSPANTPFDARARCSIPQMRAGNVQLQTMAIFTQTGKESSKQGMGQYEIFKKLPRAYPEHYKTVDASLDSPNISILPAIENASGLCNEEEPIQIIFDRIDQMILEDAKPLYISLTWNTENRFGGGAYSKAGLKEDGKRLLSYLHGKKIAVDFSHTSDSLALGILNYIDQNNINIPLMASHSNLRTVANVPRNLPDEFAQEILRRQGIIGLTFIASFIGKPGPAQFARHLDQIYQWGGEGQVSIGADFFFDEDMPSGFMDPNVPSFFDELGNSSTYPYLFSLLKQELGLTTSNIKALAQTNLNNFIRLSYAN